ncbi:MAG: hypothetical protein CMI01_18770 [Oceanospirillaceae bacterium]|nr:hypothetical protein [Oceanospirillaceae bacterium]
MVSVAGCEALQCLSAMLVLRAWKTRLRVSVARGVTLTRCVLSFVVRFLYVAIRALILPEAKDEAANGQKK